VTRFVHRLSRRLSCPLREPISKGLLIMRAR
jgi:hypothetical protein